MAPASTVPWRDGAFRHAHEPPTAWLVRHEIAPLLDELLDDGALTGVACAGVVGVRVVADAVVVVVAAGVVVAWLVAAAGVAAAGVDAGCAIATPPANIKAAPAATSKRTFIWLSKWQRRLRRALPLS